MAPFESNGLRSYHEGCKLALITRLAQSTIVVLSESCVVAELKLYSAGHDSVHLGETRIWADARSDLARSLATITMRTRVNGKLANPVVWGDPFVRLSFS